VLREGGNMERTRIEKHIIRVTNLIFLLGTSLFIYGIYRLPLESADKTGWKICILAALFVYLCLFIRFSKRQESIDIPKRYRHVSSLALMGDDMQILKEWNIYGKTGLLIGKSKGEYQADIDLSFTADAPFISAQHALLNYCSGHWYVEDAGSKNGLEVQKANQNIPFRLTEKKPLRLERGDIIRINETSLLLR